MNRKKDISKLFQESEHKLNQMPSPRAWQKLEGKLDAHAARNKYSLYRTLAIAAGIITLVSVTFVISLSLNKKHNNVMASNAMPQDLEELETYSDASEGVYEVVEFTRKHTNRLSNPIEEGQPGKRLIATWNGDEKNSRGPTVITSSYEAKQKALKLKNTYLKALKKLLSSEDVKTFFKEKTTVYIFKTDALCHAVDCINFSLENTKQEIFFADRKELFQRGDPNHMRIETINTNEIGEVNFDYVLIGSSSFK